MYRIAKRFSFEAAHRLVGLPAGHKCANLHGHNYTVEVTLAAADLDECGFVIDFGALGPVEDFLKSVLDHQGSLNDIVAFSPTSENLARYIFDQAAAALVLPTRVRLESVRVSETPTTWAEYRP